MRKFICVVFMFLILCGCERIEDSKRFVTVDRDGAWAILVDKETNVMYLRDLQNHQGGITVLVNPDGTPMLWEE